MREQSPTGTIYEAVPVTWLATGDPHAPYAATVDGQRWVVRVNEWPDAPSFYTLLVDGAPALELLAWPSAWRRPATNYAR